MEPFHPRFQLILDFDDVTTSDIHQSLSFLPKYRKKLGDFVKTHQIRVKYHCSTLCNVCHYLEGK